MGTLIITALGTGSGMLDDKRHFAAYHIRSGHFTCLLDAGEDVTRQLHRRGLDRRELNGVFISHSHADHMAGLPILLQCLHLDRRTESLNIFVPEGILSVMKLFLGIFHIHSERWSFPIRLQSIRPGRVFSSGYFTLDAFPHAHLEANQSSARALGIGCDAYSFRFFASSEHPVIYTSDIPDFSHLEGAADHQTTLITETTHVTLEDIDEFVRRRGIRHAAASHIPSPQPAGSTHVPLQWLKDGDFLRIPENQADHE